VFSVALSLALSAFAPILPASSVASGTAIAVCFTPEEDCAAFAVRAINNAERESGIEPLASAGMPIWIDARPRIAHAKTMVIDSAFTLTGSMNWTRGAAMNSEDLNLVSSPTVAAAYAAHWRERLAVSVRFDRREDWCRASSAAAH
jgi:phosphatidylserine/phosphatidylglycerophosphate/cardiolipin synthase-like enzyme